MTGSFLKLTGKNKQEPLQPRPDLVKGNPESPVILPIRTEIRVICVIDKDLEPLASTTRKFQVAGQPTLLLTIDDYIADVIIPSTYTYDSMYEREVLQVLQHEMMHMALWDDATISHSPDPTSQLYYSSDGSVISPNKWDLEVMTAAAKRIGNVTIEPRLLSDHNVDYFLRKAVANWNGWLGRNFFKLV